MKNIRCTNEKNYAILFEKWLLICKQEETLRNYSKILGNLKIIYAQKLKLYLIYAI